MIKDYAHPTMMAEKCLKMLHDAVLSKKWEIAQIQAQETIRWVREIQDALDEMRKRDEA